MSAPRTARGAGALVFGGGLAVGLVLAYLAEGRRPSAPDANAPVERTGAVPREVRLDALRLRDTLGAIVDLARAGVPQVVMINSTNCGVCKKALADLRDEARGRRVARLSVVTIEGADSGAVVLAAARVAAGAVLGPADEGGRTLLAFQFPGTPIFIALDSAARIVATMPGYPGRDAFRPWADVMFARRVRPH